MSKKYLFTSESVTEGHPDKVCDQISDAVLDEIIGKDPDARVACETATTTGIVMVMGEITTKASINIPEVVRNTIREIGYDNQVFGFDYNTCSVVTTLDKQSEDIAVGVDYAQESRNNNSGICSENFEVKAVKDSKECLVEPCSTCEGDCLDMDSISKKSTNSYNKLGAGDQGMMFGYACNETDDYMPMPIYLAHKLSKKLASVRKNNIINYLGPDGKTMVTVEYHNQKPVRVDTVVVSTQHKPDIDHGILVSDIVNHVILPEIPENLIDNSTRFLINPTGKFVKGGPCADSGLTGRKIIVDTYGGFSRHGGGAFSGKDPTKVDRTGAYAARYVAKNIVAANLAKRCEIQIAYIIGCANPVSIHVDTFGTGKIHDNKIAKIVEDVFDLRPAALINNFKLRRPIYRNLASYGHFGRPELDLPWERTDKVDELRYEAGI